MWGFTVNSFAPNTVTFCDSRGVIHVLHLCSLLVSTFLLLSSSLPTEPNIMETSVIGFILAVKPVNGFLSLTSNL